MPLKTVVARVEDIEIRVENTWSGGARLFVNQEIVSSNNDSFALSRSKPFMTARALINGTEKLIEVFIYAIFTVKIKICVDGNQVAGDDF